MDHNLLPSIVMTINLFFTLLRVAANVPQLIAIVRDPCGARAISVPSWAVFAMANGSNGVYALVMASDVVMCAVNLVSACSCGAIALVAAMRQRRLREIEALAADTGLPTHRQGVVVKPMVARRVAA